jgi:hypothetical protein
MWKNNNENRIGYGFINNTLASGVSGTIYVENFIIRLTKTKAECTFDMGNNGVYYFEESLPSGFAYNKQITFKLYATISKALSGANAQIVIAPTTTYGGTHKLISNGTV